MQLFINIGIIYIPRDCQLHFSLLETFKNQQTRIFHFQKYLFKLIYCLCFYKNSIHTVSIFLCCLIIIFLQYPLSTIDTLWTINTDLHSFQKCSYFLGFFTTVGWFWVWVQPPILSEFCNKAYGGNLYDMHSGQATFFFPFPLFHMSGGVSWWNGRAE